MSVWQGTPSAAPLRGSEGELVAVSISVNPRDLEALLDQARMLQRAARFRDARAS